MSRKHTEFFTNEHHGHWNQLPEDGDLIIPHCHDVPHLFVPLSPLKLKADTTNGIVEQVLQPGDVREISGGVQHEFTRAAPAVEWTAEKVRENAEFVAEQMNRLSGLSLCLFSRYGKDGYRADPKRWTGNPVRYE